jgi:hypothetical protein
MCSEDSLSVQLRCKNNRKRREEVGGEQRVRVRFAQNLPIRTQKRDLRKEQIGDANH